MLNETVTISTTDCRPDLNSIKARLRESGDLPGMPIEKQLSLLDELASFPLGRYLLQERCLDDYWRDYILTHPQRCKDRSLNSKGEKLSKMEDFLLNRAPLTLAAQERFDLFRRETQKLLSDPCLLASIPSRNMNELLSLDYSYIEKFKLIGIDNNPLTLKKALDNAKKKKLDKRTLLLCYDAWEIPQEGQVDLITSNGLNIYTNNDIRLQELYRRFFLFLKPGGTLITSFLTPPPGHEVKCEWVMDEINPCDAQLQKILLEHIINAKSPAYRSTGLTRYQLNEAGFSSIKIYYDVGHMFPTVLAHKS